VTLRFIAIAALAAGFAAADTYTIYDPFPGSSCADPACDVIGPNADFDVQKIVFDRGPTTTINIYTNFQNPSLAQWLDSGALWLNAGDLFLSFSGSAYGIALSSHDSFLTGNLYKIDPAQSRNADNVLGAQNPGVNLGGWVFRHTENVWLGGPANPVANVLESIDPAGGADAAYKVTLSFTSPDFLSDFQKDGGVGIHFASTTCGNDVINGFVPVPEAGTYMLVLGGLLALAGLDRYRRVRS
jgi:hypothetical protein